MFPKKIGLFLLLLAAPAVSAAGPPVINARACILVETKSGGILFEKNSSLPLPPASLTKMMTEYIVLQKLSEGSISWQDRVPVSDYAYRISSDWRLSDFYLKKDNKYSVRSLMEAVSVYSSNSAAIALAEFVAGSEKEFVKAMNSEAGAMGLENTSFYDCTGLSNCGVRLGTKYPEGGNRMSARDAALLSERLINDHPEILELTGLVARNFSHGNGEYFRLNNWNWMLPGKRYYYRGVDGIKTGHTDSAGYCFACSAERDGMRLITVVMGAASIGVRFTETAKLLDYGFDSFRLDILAPAGYAALLPVKCGETRYIAVRTDRALYALCRAGEPASGIDTVIYGTGEERAVPAPLKAGVPAGYIKPAGTLELYGSIYTENSIKNRVMLYPERDVDRSGFLSCALSFLTHLSR